MPKLDLEPLDLEPLDIEPLDLDPVQETTERPWYSVTPEGLAEVGKGVLKNAPFSNVAESIYSAGKAGYQSLTDAEDPRGFSDYYDEQKQKYSNFREESDKNLGTAGNIATSIPYALTKPMSAPLEMASSAIDAGSAKALSGGSLEESLDAGATAGMLSGVVPAIGGAKSVAQDVKLTDLVDYLSKKSGKWLGKVTGRSEDVLNAYEKNPQRYDDFASEAAESGGVVSHVARPIKDKIDETTSAIKDASHSKDLANANMQNARLIQENAWSQQKVFPVDVIDTVRGVLKQQRGKIGEAAEKQLDALRQSDAKVDLSSVKGVLEDALDSKIGDPAQRAKVQYFLNQIKGMEPDVEPSLIVDQFSKPIKEIAEEIPLTDPIQTRKLRAGMQENIPYGKNDWDAADRTLNSASKEVNAALDKALPEASELRGKVSQEAGIYEGLSKLFGNEGQEWNVLQSTFNNPQKLQALKELEKQANFNISDLPPIQQYLSVKNMSPMEKKAILESLPEAQSFQKAAGDLDALKQTKSQLPTDAEGMVRATINASERVPHLKAQDQAKAVENVLPGTGDQLEKARVAGQFVDRGPQGSRFVNAAGNVGAAITRPFGAPGVGKAVGTAFGMSMDYGSGKTIQGLLNLKNTPPAKFLNILVNALQRGGPKSVQSTHFLLMQQNPEYRQSTMKDKEDDQMGTSSDLNTP
jgi:hypothetical protein